ncbi:maleylpyruvate isomerase family mycothiol-dependent enzyme, partial [Pseudonocardia sp. GCM10023141]|uniref:maleylpyruvate isomerase family mycothiol-dependent enzyme n=1 Tax=Pseudonocardia sp. GCM10023141 TaxID=3252653 RepID=UPI00360A7ED6
MSTAVDTMSLAHDERADLANLLDTLTPAQWDSPSLCAGWRVRDVVAHMFSYEELGIGGLVGRFIKGGVNPDRVNAVGVSAYAERSTDALVELVRNHLRPRGLTAGFGGRIARALTPDLGHGESSTLLGKRDDPDHGPQELLRGVSSAG